MSASERLVTMAGSACEGSKRSRMPSNSLARPGGRLRCGCLAEQCASLMVEMIESLMVREDGRSGPERVADAKSVMGRARRLEQALMRQRSGYASQETSLCKHDLHVCVGRLRLWTECQWGNMLRGSRTAGGSCTEEVSTGSSRDDRDEWDEWEQVG